MALAAYAGEGAIMRLLAEHGADQSLRPDNDLTTLMLAAGASRIPWISRVSQNESLEAVEAALELGADVNEANGQGNTALHEAAKKGSVEVVQFLVDAGANIGAKNKRGQTAVDVARYDAANAGKPENRGKRPPVWNLLKRLSAQSEVLKL